MNDPERMDLSALDPNRDRLHWARILDATRVRIEAALAGRRAPQGPLDILGAWSRPILAAAAVLAVALGAAGLMIGSPASRLDGASEARRLAALSEHSIGRGERPTGTQLLVALRSRSTP
jgi:hypothetical protein